MYRICCLYILPVDVVDDFFDFSCRFLSDTGSIRVACATNSSQGIDPVLFKKRQENSKKVVSHVYGQ
jgi:hypothetical protein